MKLNELEFTRDDFQMSENPEGIAAIANKLLNERLEKAQEVFCGFKDDTRFWGVPDSTGQTIVHECELKARLVCIEDNHICSDYCHDGAGVEK